MAGESRQSSATERRTVKGHGRVSRLHFHPPRLYLLQVGPALPKLLW